MKEVFCLRYRGAINGDRIQVCVDRVAPGAREVMSRGVTGLADAHLPPGIDCYGALHDGTTFKASTQPGPPWGPRARRGPQPEVEIDLSRFVEIATGIWLPLRDEI